MHFPVHLLQEFLQTYGYIAVFLFVAIESSGIPFPGETMLVTAAAYAGAGHLQIPTVVGAAAAGAIIGDNLGYLIGRTGGRSLALRFGRYVWLDERKLQHAEAFYARHGSKAVFLGRFIAILRAWSAFLAGINRMPWPTFFAFDAAAAICWSTLYGTLAFFLGKNLPLLHRVLQGMGIGGVLLAAVVAAALFIIHRRATHMAARIEEPEPEDADAAVSR